MNNFDWMLPQRAGQAPARAVCSLSMDADEQLMQRYLGGDKVAFGTLYAGYKDRIFRFLMRLTGSPATAEELAQDTWIRVLDAASRYQARGTFKAYLFQIAHRLALDWLRRDRSKLMEPIDERVLNISFGDEPLRALDGEQDAARLHAAIDALPAEQRAAVLLQAEGELTLEEIAALMQTGRETIKSRLRYALHKLKEALR